MVLDSCHSGGLIDKEKEQIGPSTVADRAVSRQPRGRLIPYESVLEHLTALSGIHSLLLGNHLSHLFGHEISPLFSELSGITTHPLRLRAFSNAIRIVLKEDESALSNRELVTRTRKVLKEGGFAQHPCLYCSDENADAPFLWQPTQQQQQPQALMGSSWAFEGEITAATKSKASVRWNMDSS
uniref:Metacaspase-9 n=1 Tax=Ananas comosus var. bracteatus TaxID=296719 RepID=A0A6V7NFM0_ANACO|nr:unnamed protein product [Ananas comosus var. bracteatus]